MVYYPDLYLWLLNEYENVILNLSFIPLGEGRDFPQVARDFLKSFPFFVKKLLKSCSIKKNVLFYCSLPLFSLMQKFANCTKKVSFVQIRSVISVAR